MKLDENILDALNENFNPENNSIFYRLKIDDSMTLVYWDGEIKEIPSNRILGKPPVDFGIYMYHPSTNKFDIATSVNFYSNQNTCEINNKQIERLFFILNRLLKNSIDSGLKGEITQSMELSRKENLAIGPINTSYTRELPQISERLPSFSNFLYNDKAMGFREYRNCKATYNFEEGIANNIRGDIVYERLGYMNPEGEVGGLGIGDIEGILDDYFARDLKLKEILANIKLG